MQNKFLFVSAKDKLFLEGLEDEIDTFHRNIKRKLVDFSFAHIDSSWDEGLSLDDALCEAIRFVWMNYWWIGESALVDILNENIHLESNHRLRDCVGELFITKSPLSCTSAYFVRTDRLVEDIAHLVCNHFHLGHNFTFWSDTKNKELVLTWNPYPEEDESEQEDVELARFKCFPNDGDSEKENPNYLDFITGL